MQADRRYFAWCLVALCPAFAFCQTPTPSSQGTTQNNEGQVAHFGTTVVISLGAPRRNLFHPTDCPKLPRFEKLTPVGTIYTSELNVPRHDFDGISRRHRPLGG